jgi:RNA polymerase sigma-70 factor (ECF subfamily)
MKFAAKETAARKSWLTQGAARADNFENIVATEPSEISQPKIGTTLRVQQGLDRLAQGDEQARKELLEHGLRRLKLLAARMLRAYPQWNRPEEVDDLFQQAMLRLWESLETLRPKTSQHFFRLAAMQMRWALLDLLRRSKADGRPLPLSISNNASDAHLEPFDTTHVPDQLLFWTDFHNAVEQLPEREKAVVDLIWYHGASRTEVATELGVSTRQVLNYWQSGKRMLRRKLKEHFASDDCGIGGS